jgi:outer membrane protein OmpA-like peptidoglycan-associated protein
MKNIFLRLMLTVTVCLTAGCASYSGFVNSFAPERGKGLMATAATESKPSGKSPFCVEPPVAAKPVTEIYMVMPEEGGKAGTVDIIFKDGKTIQLHGDYSAASLAGDEQKTFTSNSEEMKKTFGEAVSALPKAPIFATLYFLFGKDELTPDSKTEAEKIYQDFLKRQEPEILIIGHTDTVGSAVHNLRLSVKRAEKVRQALIKLGIPAQNIQTSGRGESELLIATPDNTKEPKNRRAEINVR